jgi:hypothetical protein
MNLIMIIINKTKFCIPSHFRLHSRDVNLDSHGVILSGRVRKTSKKNIKKPFKTFEKTQEKFQNFFKKLVVKNHFLEKILKQ